MVLFQKDVPSGLTKLHCKVSTFLNYGGFLRGEARHTFLEYEILHLGILWFCFLFIFYFGLFLNNCYFYETFTIMFLCFQISPEQSYRLTYSRASEIGFYFEFSKTRRKTFGFANLVCLFPLTPVNQVQQMIYSTTSLCKPFFSSIVYHLQCNYYMQVIFCLVVAEYHNSPLQAATLLTSMAISQINFAKVNISKD